MSGFGSPALRALVVASALAASTVAVAPAVAGGSHHGNGGQYGDENHQGGKNNQGNGGHHGNSGHHGNPGHHGNGAGQGNGGAQSGGTLPYQNARLPVRKRVQDLLSRMTLAEKIGQMTQAERANVGADGSKITTDNLGSVLSGGGSVPSPNTPTAWADMVDQYQRAALATRLQIPLIYGIDTVHGDGNMYGATVFPHNIGLGASRDPRLVADVEHVAAEETRTTGPQWAFAPCICVARDDRWGRTYESFGEDPRLVEEMETAIQGFQGSPGQLADPDRVLATAKHFAGDGLTTYGTGSNNHTTGNYPIDQGVDR